MCCGFQKICFCENVRWHVFRADVLSVVPEEKRKVLEARMTSSKDSNAVLVGSVVGFGGEGGSKDGVTTSGETMNTRAHAHTNTHIYTHTYARTSSGQQHKRSSAHAMV